MLKRIYFTFLVYSSEGVGTEFEFEKGTFSGLQRNNKKIKINKCPR